MASDPRFDKNTNQYDQTAGEFEEPARGRSKWTNGLIGCLGVLAFMILLAVIAGIWIARNWRVWFADFGSQAINQSIDASDLPAQEKAEMKQQVARVDKALRDGRISGQQLAT